MRDKKAMHWLLSQLVFVNGLVGALVKFVSQNEDAFSTITNLSYLLPLLLLIPNNNDQNNPRPFFPSVYLLCVLLGMGSLAHHLRGCDDANYRVLDHVFYLLTYGFLMGRSAWTLCCHDTTWRFVIRLFMLLTVSLIVIFYNFVLAYNVEFMVTFGCISGVLVLFGVFRRRRQNLLECVLSLALVLLTIGLATIFNVGVSPHTSERYVYDMEHGMWHLFIAKFQFILISTLVTSGPIPHEPVTMVVDLLVLIVFFVFERTEIVGSGWYALVFLVPSSYLLVSIVFRCRIRARILLNPLKLEIRRNHILVFPVDSCE